MGVKVASSCLQWSQPPIPHSPSSSHALASAISSPSRRRTTNDGALVSRYVNRLDRSSLFGTIPTTLYRSRSCEYSKSRTQKMRRACSASFDAFSDEEFSEERIRELALRFQLSDDDDHDEAASEVISDSADTRDHDGGEISTSFTGSVNFVHNQKSFPSSRFDPLEPPEWPGRDESIPACIERKANSVELPHSLRLVKKKKQWQNGFKEVGESAYCSVKKAFSSMVFIIRELHCYTLQMRELLFYEDLQGILVRVQIEMHASFVWLFQQVFSHTPTLMIHIMILLANYSVYSMASNDAIAAAVPPQAYAATTESVSTMEDQSHSPEKFDSLSIRTFSLSSTTEKTTSIGGSNGGGGKFRPFASGTDGDGRFDGSVSSGYQQTFLPDGVSSVGNPTTTSKDESVSGQVSMEEELKVWNSMVEEASRMQAALRHDAMDHETMQNFVSPVTVKIEADNYADYFRTELLYQKGLSQEPNNPLLLANYAQFLYLVAQDYDRAEEYFKRAAKVEPKDADALSKYASFLWQVRKDLWAAEETYLEAISADPSNSYYAANYAHFLWNTGAEDTCFPLNDPDEA